MGIDHVGMGGNGNVKSHSRSSLGYTHLWEALHKLHDTTLCSRRSGCRAIVNKLTNYYAFLQIVYLFIRLLFSQPRVQNNSQSKQ